MMKGEGRCNAHTLYLVTQFWYMHIKVEQYLKNLYPKIWHVNTHRSANTQSDTAYDYTERHCHLGQDLFINLGLFLCSTQVNSHSNKELTVIIFSLMAHLHEYSRKKHLINRLRICRRLTSMLARAIIKSIESTLK